MSLRKLCDAIARRLLFSLHFFPSFSNSASDASDESACWSGTPLRRDLEAVFSGLRANRSLTEQQLSQNYFSLNVDLGNGFGFLDAFGYSLCSQLWLEWTNRLPKKTTVLGQWANERQYSWQPPHDYPTDCAGGKIILSYLCQHYCLEEVEFMVDLPFHSTKNLESGGRLDLGPVLWCATGFNELMKEEAEKWRARQLLDYSLESCKKYWTARIIGNGFSKL